jgi:acetoin utilization deacetylase AcuC-like enzyme
MTTAYLSHPLFLQHEMGSYHPECPERLTAIEQALEASGYLSRLQQNTAPRAEREVILRVHQSEYLKTLDSASPANGYTQLDPDTAMNPHSLDAAYHAAGAAVMASELILEGKVDNAFCAVRPPGHHAEPGRAMGFCFFNNIAVAAAHAIEAYGLERVAIIDFDVHHGNGTEAMFRGDERVLYCSSFQHPFYPGTRLEDAETNIILAPLQAGDGSNAFRAAYEESIFPALETFRPQMIFISAGFDAHIDDGLAGIQLEDQDYVWVTERITGLAARYCKGRIVSLLEGGYALDTLGRCASLHIGKLLTAGQAVA